MSADPRIAALPAVRRLAEEQADDLVQALPVIQEGPITSDFAQVIVEQLSDLSRDASRDAVARLVAERLGMEVGATAPRFVREEENGIAAWFLDTGAVAWMFWTFQERCYLRERIRWAAGVTTSIDGIGAVTDPTEALTLIALHILGTPNA